MPGMTPEQQAAYALDYGIARSDLPEDAQLAYDREVEQRARAVAQAHAAAPAPVSGAVALDSVKLAEKIGVAAMTGWHDRLYLAWVGHSLNPRQDWELVLAYSPDGREIMGKQRLGQRSYGKRRSAPGPDPGPSLAVSGEHLYLAWTGTDEHVTILADPQSPHEAPVWVDDAWSWYDPALCSHEDRLVLAWTSADQYVTILADPQSPHGAPVRLDEARSCRGPALCSHQGRLVLAWRDNDGHINILADPQSPHGAPVRLEEARSCCGPALCSYQGRLVLAWTGTDDHVNILADPQSPHDAPVRLEARTGPMPCPVWRSSFDGSIGVGVGREDVRSGPVLCTYQGSLILAWRGTDGHMNLSPLRWLEA